MNNKLPLDIARGLYKTSDAQLKEYALSYYSKAELSDEIPDGLDSLEGILNHTSSDVSNLLSKLTTPSKEILELQLIREVLHKCTYKELPKFSGYIPRIRIFDINRLEYNNAIDSNKAYIIGYFKRKDVEEYYRVILFREPVWAHSTFSVGINTTDMPNYLLLCKSEAIAQHIGKYFWNIIVKILYPDAINIKSVLLLTP